MWSVSGGLEWWRRANASLVHRDLGRGALCLSGIFLRGHSKSMVERLLEGGWETNAQMAVRIHNE